MTSERLSCKCTYTDIQWSNKCICLLVLEICIYCICNIIFVKFYMMVAITNVVAYGQSFV